MNGTSHLVMKLEELDVCFGHFKNISTKEFCFCYFENAKQNQGELCWAHLTQLTKLQCVDKYFVHGT